ncbi:GDYXXLXY domain-containing protein [Sinimarinibacterium flocculans]|uniref:GDYXXLXY domain-containing protein n=1 Tax=Sinimarinibacterium flocculans TaxID=985250 RepID=UPI0035154EEA
MIGIRAAAALLTLAVILQWAVPGHLIRRGQQTLEQGTAYRFRTAPVDPVDPFRGRYVALDFEAARVPLPRGQGGYRRGQRVYAPIRVDDGGDAVLGAPLRQPPESGDWLEATVLWVNADELRLRLPFDRYYLDEHHAPEVERRYRDTNRMPADGEDPRRPAWAQVRVRNGYALIEMLYVDGRPVSELMREPAASL